MKFRDDQYFFKKYCLEQEADLFFIQQQQRSYDDSIQKLVDNLDLFYLTEKLKNSCEMINRRVIIKADYKLWFIDHIIYLVEQNHSYFKQFPTVMVYYTIYKMLTEPENDLHYQQLVSRLEIESDKFSKEEARSMYNYIRNYCIRKVNEGNQNYLKELFELFKVLINKQLILRSNMILQWDYKNIISVALRNKAYAWTEQFIHQYKAHLDPKYRENALSYNLAYLYYEKGQNDKAISELHKVEFDDIFYHLDAKVLLMKSYFDLEEENAFHSLVDSFRIYLRRNKLITRHQQVIYQNFIRLAAKLFRLKINLKLHGKQDKKKLDRLRREIVNTKGVANVSWLLHNLDILADSDSF